MKFHICQFYPLLKNQGTGQSWTWVRPIGAWGVPYLASLKASDIGWEPDWTLLGPQESINTPSSNSSSLEPTGKPQLTLDKTRRDLENSTTKKERFKSSWEALCDARQCLAFRGRLQLETLGLKYQPHGGKDTSVLLGCTLSLSFQLLPSIKNKWLQFKNK